MKLNNAVEKQRESKRLCMWLPYLAISHHEENWDLLEYIAFVLEDIPVVVNNNDDTAVHCLAQF